MKTIQFFLVAALLIFFTGCAKDTLVPADGSSGLELRTKEYVTKPMTMWLEAITDPAMGVVLCVPGGAVPAGGVMQGHATHMGQFIAEESPWAHGSCYLVFDANGNVTSVMIEGSHGHWTAANGDILSWQGTYQSFLDGSFSGDLNFIGGTGRFEDATGNVFGFGKTDPETGYAVGTVQGYITMMK